MNRINLGQSGPTFGLQQAGLAQALMPQQQRRVVGDVDKSRQYGDSARAYGMTEALQPIEVSSGTWGEALAEALAGGLRGRAARNERQGQVDQEQWDQNRTDKQEAGQRMAISEALAGFDPNNPQALVQGLREQAPEQALSLAGALAGREPQETFSEPFDHNGVQVQRSSTTNQLRPVGNPPAAMIYQPPAGYRGTPDQLEPIPGGPVDTRTNESGRARRDRLQSSASQLQNAIDVLNTAEGQVSGWTAGAGGQALRGFGGTPAHDLQQTLEPVIAILAFENLAEMRRNSETGGALGSIAVRELDLLSRTVRSLETTQGPEQLRANIAATRTQLSRTLAAVQAARQEMENGPDAAPQEPNMANEQVPQGNGLEGMSTEQLQEMLRQMRGNQ